MSTEHVITVMSYNVHRCVGRDGLMDPSRVATVLREIRPDIVGLQEISVEGKGDLSARQLDYLQRVTELKAVFGPNLRSGENLYGNALLTSGTTLEDRQHDLSVEGREPRGAMEVRIELAGQRMAVVVTHLGLDVKERRVQLGRLSKIVPTVSDEAPFLIVMGDFNEWRPRASYLRALDDRLGRLASPRTFPAGFPLLALDRIWVHPRTALRGLAAHRSPMARAASDHLPLVARIALTQELTSTR